GGQHQVPGEGRLGGHLGGGQVADLPHHDDVRVLAHQGADAGGKVEVDIGLHLGLVEAVLHHLDGVLHGADVHFLRGQLLEGGVEGGGLAGTGGACDQHD